MILGLIVGALACIAGLIRGGRISALLFTPIRALWLLPLAVIFQFATLSDRVTISPVVLLLAANALLLVILFVNRSYSGVGIAALGLLLNSLVIGLNGAMPVSPEAGAVAGLTRQDIEAGGPEHAPAGSQTRLSWLGDVIPIPRSELVVSVGDLFLALGLARFLYRRTLSSAEVGPTRIRAPGEVNA